MLKFLFKSSYIHYRLIDIASKDFASKLEIQSRKEDVTLEEFMIKVSEASLKLDFPEFHQTDGSAFSESLKSIIQNERKEIEQKIEAELNLSLVKIRSRLDLDIVTFKSIQSKILDLQFGKDSIEFHVQFSSYLMEKQITNFLDKFNLS